MKRVCLVLAVLVAACSGKDDSPPPAQGPVADAFAAQVLTVVATGEDAEPVDVDGVVASTPEDAEPAPL